jgi:hypothetical protein
LAEAGGEGLQVGLVIGVDGGDPRIEPVAVATGKHLGEPGDMAGEGVEVRTAGSDLFDAELVVGMQVVGVA